MIVTKVKRNSYNSIAEIESVVHGFQWCTLPRERWTHAAHLTVALWYHLRLPWPHAEKLVRVGIQRFNQAHGIVTTPSGGYHETMTLFWIRMVREYLDDVRAEKLSVLTLFNKLIERCGRKELPLEYYSRERLMSLEARANWVEPDLKTLN
ncbi:MAG TPA: hypothetical protein VN920_03845 [Pyrinomonadaceae bacterium]|nr:hypothetical protein [Pyrinomonadaceae bacterium]